MGSYKDQQKEKMPSARILYNEGLSVGQISKILSMSRATLYCWLAIFAEENKNTMSVKGKNSKGDCITAPGTKGKATAQVPVKDKTESAEQKIARLEKELCEARLRADFYDEMINVAEKKFDIQIRKTAGARQ